MSIVGINCGRGLKIPILHIWSCCRCRSLVVKSVGWRGLKISRSTQLWRLNVTHTHTVRERLGLVSCQAMTHHLYSQVTHPLNSFIHSLIRSFIHSMFVYYYCTAVRRRLSAVASRSPIMSHSYRSLYRPRAWRTALTDICILENRKARAHAQRVLLTATHTRAHTHTELTSIAMSSQWHVHILMLQSELHFFARVIFLQSHRLVAGKCKDTPRGSLHSIPLPFFSMHAPLVFP